MFYEIDVFITRFPEPYWDGYARQNKVGSIAWNVSSAGFVNVAEVHEESPPKKKATGDGAIKAPTRDDQATLPDAVIILEG